ncbi:rhodopsin, GQ-coupled-like [Acanthaster planci]|uniref:Rhodopsin, GQ-coupled-like n=1 Tax=Acanthaster planci TaxID=133434 RepID=A0A8B7XVZ4_ACAPL|nr:rhodopsin, GQ-coupled-like [Acanthaster planci]
MDSVPSEAQVNSTDTVESIRDGDNLPQKVRIGYAVVVAVMAVGTVTGNLLVCLTLRQFSMPAGHSLMSLAVSNIIVGGLVMPCSSVTVLLRQWVFGPAMCLIVAFLKSVSLLQDCLTFCVVAVDRYLTIKGVRLVSTRRYKLMSVVFPWMASLPMATAPLLGWGGYAWSPSKPVCSIDWLQSQSYTLAVFATFGFLPNVIMCTCYLSIGMYVHRQKKRMKMSTISGIEPGRKRSSLKSGCDPTPGCVRISREEVSIIKSTVALVSFFSIVVSPYMATHLISLGLNQAPSLRTESIVMGILFFGACMNPVVYSGSCKKFRQMLKKTVTRLFCR